MPKSSVSSRAAFRKLIGQSDPPPTPKAHCPYVEDAIRREAAVRARSAWEDWTEHGWGADLKGYEPAFLMKVISRRVYEDNSYGLLPVTLPPPPPARAEYRVPPLAPWSSQQEAQRRHIENIVSQHTDAT